MRLKKLPSRSVCRSLPFQRWFPLARVAAIATTATAQSGKKNSVGQVALQVGTSHPTLIEDKKQTSYVRIALTGSESESIRAGGSTALFAGISKGAAETRKLSHDESVNRVILLSESKIMPHLRRLPYRAHALTPKTLGTATKGPEYSGGTG